MTRFRIVRSTADKNLHLIYRDDVFDALPSRIRQLGPWQGLMGGEITALKPHYRALVDEQDFALVYLPVGNFRPTAP